MEKQTKSLKNEIVIRLKKFHNKHIFIEISLILVITLLIGFTINPKDPFLIEESSQLNYFYIPVVIVSLFYGIGAGLFLLLSYIIIEYIYLFEFSTKFFLDGLLLTLIAGEFHYYWTRKIESVQAKVRYLEEKVREIGVSSLAIKLSHDQLEKSYLSKPYTLRAVISEITKKRDINDFLKLLANRFHINKFSLVRYENDSIKETYTFGSKDEPIDLNNSLIEKMFFIKEIVYVKDIIDKDEKIGYIASIPIIDFNGEIKAFILIKEMPFLHYNPENLLAIQLISQYFFLELEKENKMKNLEKPFLKNLSIKPRYELLRLYQLNKSIKVESSIVIFELDNKFSDIIDNFLKRSLRALDFYTKFSLKNKEVYMVVLPLISKEGGYGFVNRVFKTFDFIEDKYRYFVFNIKNIKDVDNILKDLLKNAK